jgi:hypothetical protein
VLGKRQYLLAIPHSVCAPTNVLLSGRRVVERGTSKGDESVKTNKAEAIRFAPRDSANLQAS